MMATASTTPRLVLAEAQFGAPYYHAHRADLLDVLLDGVGNTGFRLNARIEEFAQTAAHVTLTLADGTEATGDVLIAADGIHSTVRSQLFGKELPRYTGNVSWRGLVPAERVAHLDLGGVTGVWMGPNRSIVQYYVAAGRTFNWIGISRSGQSARESWLAEGRIDDALAEYSGWHTTIRTIIAATPRVLRQALYDREPAAGLAGRTRRAAGRCRAPDDAVLRPGRRSEHRRRLRASGVHRGDPDRTGGRAATLRAASPAAHRLDAGFIAPRGGTLPDDRRGCDRGPQRPHADQSHPRVGKLPARANATLRLRCGCGAAGGRGHDTTGPLIPSSATTRITVVPTHASPP
jgi:hypothetical protein